MYMLRNTFILSFEQKKKKKKKKKKTSKIWWTMIISSFQMYLKWGEKIGRSPFFFSRMNRNRKVKVNLFSWFIYEVSIWQELQRNVLFSRLRSKSHKERKWRLSNWIVARWRWLLSLNKKLKSDANMFHTDVKRSSSPSSSFSFFICSTVY